VAPVARSQRADAGLVAWPKRADAAPVALLQRSDAASVARLHRPDAASVDLPWRPDAGPARLPRGAGVPRGTSSRPRSAAVSPPDLLATPALRARLAHGAAALGLELAPEALDALLGYASELLRWNEKVNLTTITAPEAVLDKHLLDSLAVVPEARGAASLLDLGSGAGLPGIPLGVALPGLRLTLVDAVAKKVAFLKAGLVRAGLAGRARAVHARLAGAPQAEGLELAEVVVSRAFMELGSFLRLARPYLAPGGRVVALVGPGAGDAAAHARAGEAAGLALVASRAFQLPLSGDPRAVATFVVRS
jgi:16S rRNA (guanine527-N7)-methyltransferase